VIAGIGAQANRTELICVDAAGRVGYAELAPVLQEIQRVCEKVSQSSAARAARDTAEQFRMALDRYATAR